MENNNNPQERNIFIPNDIADKTVYANTMMARHSSEEFILDFIQTLPGLPGPTVITRVIVTPGTAKRIAEALKENTAMYEKNFGPVNNQSSEARGLTIPVKGGQPKS